MEMHIDAIISALLGSGIASALAKAYIAKSFRELEQIAEKIGEIKVELSAIAVRLGHAEKDRDILMKHDRKLAAMENEIYGHGDFKKSKANFSAFPGQ